jgi:hypothetical protein
VSQSELEELVVIVNKSDALSLLSLSFCCRGEASGIPVVRSFGRSFGRLVASLARGLTQAPSSVQKTFDANALPFITVTCHPVTPHPV